MQKILSTGNLNIGDPFVGALALILIPQLGSWPSGSPAWPASPW